MIMLPFDSIGSHFKAGKTCGRIWLVGKAPLGAPSAQIWGINVVLSLLQILAVDLPRSAAWTTLQGSELGVKCGTGRDIVSINSFPQPLPLQENTRFFPPLTASPFLWLPSGVLP